MAGKPQMTAGRALIAALALVGVVALALLGGWGGGSPERGRGTVATPQAESRAPASEARAPQGKVWGATVGFANRERLDDHYHKHGAEFGDISRQEYLRRAQALRDAPVDGPILEAVRRDGVITRFDRATGAFLAFNPNGVIRTFFRPNDGERYFRRQLERDG